MNHPWWPHLFSWPRVLDPISWWWLSVKGYALTSSWFNVAWIWFAVHSMRRHNCHHHGCPRVGKHQHPEHGLLCRRHFIEAGGQIPGLHYKLGEGVVNEPE